MRIPYFDCPPAVAGDQLQRWVNNALVGKLRGRAGWVVETTEKWSLDDSVGIDMSCRWPGRPSVVHVDITLRYESKLRQRFSHADAILDRRMLSLIKDDLSNVEEIFEKAVVFWSQIRKLGPAN
jgi:hypothetical protein